jgi:hypothetical protein
LIIPRHQSLNSLRLHGNPSWKIVRKSFGLTILALAVFCGESFGWNDHGHKVAARIAWNKLNNQNAETTPESLKGSLAIPAEVLIFKATERA